MSWNHGTQKDGVYTHDANRRGIKEGTPRTEAATRVDTRRLRQEDDGENANPEITG
jgi:hypothetical protein